MSVKTIGVVHVEVMSVAARVRGFSACRISRADLELVVAC